MIQLSGGMTFHELRKELKDEPSGGDFYSKMKQFREEIVVKPEDFLSERYLFKSHKELKAKYVDVFFICLYEPEDRRYANEMEKSWATIKQNIANGISGITNGKKDPEFSELKKLQDFSSQYRIDQLSEVVVAFLHYLDNEEGQYIDFEIVYDEKFNKCVVDFIEWYNRISNKDIH